MVANFENKLNNLDLHGNFRGCSNENKIRSILNKVTMKTLDKFKMEMSECIAQIVTSGSGDELHASFKLILSMSSANRGYNAAKYAAIIKEVAGIAPCIHDQLAVYIDSYKNDLSSLSHVSSLEYDEYCKYVKRRDQLRGSMAMIKTLQMCGVLPFDVIIDVLNFLLVKIQEWCRVKEKVDHVEELMEHMYLLVVGSIGTLQMHPIWCQTLFPKIQVISRLRNGTNGNCGVSTKAHFRCNDVISMQAVAVIARK